MKEKKIDYSNIAELAGWLKGVAEMSEDSWSFSVSKQEAIANIATEILKKVSK